MYVCMYVYIYVCVKVFIRNCIEGYTHVYMRGHSTVYVYSLGECRPRDPIHVCMYVCKQLCMYICMYVCMSAYLVDLMYVPAELVDVLLASWCWCGRSRWPQKL